MDVQYYARQLELLLGPPTATTVHEYWAGAGKGEDEGTVAGKDDSTRWSTTQGKFFVENK